MTRTTSKKYLAIQFFAAVAAAAAAADAAAADAAAPSASHWRGGVQVGTTSCGGQGGKRPTPAIMIKGKKGKGNTFMQTVSEAPPVAAAHSSEG